MQRIHQRADNTPIVVLAALLFGVPLLGRGQVPANPTFPNGFIALAVAAPASVSATNQAVTNIARSNVPTPARSHTRSKAGVLAAGALIAITILIVACGLALLSSFKKR